MNQASSSVPGVSAREAILAGIRNALRDVPADESAGAAALVRDYRDAHVSEEPAALVELLAANLADCRARVHRTAPADVPVIVGRLLADRGSASYVIPPGLPAAYLPDQDIDLIRIVDPGPDNGSRPLAARELDRVDSVVTACAVAIAETGTIVLDAGADQGRRALTLVPDHHVCIVRVPGQVVASVGQALRRLDPSRPLTWISGPSATSDIEFERVEGVHGPRRFDVILVDPAAG